MKYAYTFLLLACLGFRSIAPEYISLHELSLLANYKGYAGFDAKMKTLGYTLDSKNENDNYTTFTSYMYTKKDKDHGGSITLNDYADGKPQVVYSYTKNLKNIYRWEMPQLGFVPEKKQHTINENEENLSAFENKQYRLHYSFTTTKIDETLYDTTFSVDVWRK